MTKMRRRKFGVRSNSGETALFDFILPVKEDA